MLQYPVFDRLTGLDGTLFRKCGSLCLGAESGTALALSAMRNPYFDTGYTVKVSGFI